MKKIKLSRNKFALVSNEDFERVNAHKWSYKRSSNKMKKEYAVRRTKKEEKDRWAGSQITMHSFICDLTPYELNGEVIDHSDDDGLNNQRNNLEPMTQRENMLKCPNWKRRKK